MPDPDLTWGSILHNISTITMADDLKNQPIHDDDVQLASMGHQPELKRNFSMMSMLGLAFAIMNVCCLD